MILYSKRVMSHSNKWTDKPLSLIDRAFSGNPKGVAPKNFSGGSAPGPPNPSRFALASSGHSRLALRARAGDCQLLGWIRPCLSWIDYKKAYDMVPHSWLMECTTMLGIALNVREMLSNSMKSWKVELTSG